MKFPGLDREVEENTLFSLKMEGGEQVLPDGRTMLVKSIRQNYDVYPIFPQDWRWDWMIEDQKAVFKGSLPKRVASFMYKQYKKKVDDWWLAEIGTLLSKTLTQVPSATVDFTRHIRWGAYQFGQKSGSCYWGGKRQAREMIEDNGGAFRLWREAPEHYSTSHRRDIKHKDGKAYQGFARAWVIPKPDLGVSFMFNVYGLDGRNHEAAIWMAHWLGLEWAEVGIENQGSTSGTLWMNHDRARGGALAFAIGSLDAVKALKNSVYDLDIEDPSED